ncbi:globin-like protein [Trichoderma evansii]
MSLTAQQVKLVRETIPALTEHGELIASTFYGNMLRAHPELNDYFNTVNMANGRQPRALIAIILSFANNITQITELVPKMERMCQKHCSLGILPEHYDIVGKYLIAAFGEILGPAMTPSVQIAWNKAYWVLAKMLIGREAQLYSDWQHWQGWRRFRIQQKVEESDDTYSYYLVPEDGKLLPSFMPGQYVSVRVMVPEIGYWQNRQYSLSEQPKQEYYRITIKRDRGAQKVSQPSYLWSSYGSHPGIVSNIIIDQKNVGDIIELTHPAGEFFLDTYNTANAPLVLLSAGVGVTPMVSILNSVIEKQPSRPISWIQGSRDSVPFYLHVRKIARDRPTMKVNIFKTQLADSDLAGITYDHDAKIDLAKVHREDLWLDNSATEYFVCGPEQFMMEMARRLREFGVNSGRIKLELFSTGDTEFQVDALSIASGRSLATPRSGVASGAASTNSGSD